MTGLIRAAAAVVDRDAWTNPPIGEPVRRGPKQSTVRAMLRMLDLEPGMRVLEIGTGSGYSSALLARSVGRAGHVVSLDPDAALADRAALLHAAEGNHHVEVHAVDGRTGWPYAGPYDRVIAWAAPPTLPRAWVEQTLPGAVIVTPVSIAEIARATAVIRCTITKGRPTGLAVYSSSFAEMTPAPVADIKTPRRFVNAVLSHDDGGVWVSARAWHDQPTAPVEARARELASATPRPGFVDDTDRAAFTAYLLATTLLPASAGTHHGTGVGIADRTSIALVLPDGSQLTAGDGAARDLTALRRHWRTWQRPQRPAHERIVATTAPVDDGWVIRTTTTSRGREPNQ